MSVDGCFKDKHLWVKKATGLGVTEFMLRIMAWLCTKDVRHYGHGNDNGQMCIVHRSEHRYSNQTNKKNEGHLRKKIRASFSE